MSTHPSGTREYKREYAREYRAGKRRGWRKVVPGSRAWLKARRATLGLTRSRAPVFVLAADDPRGREEPIGPQTIPFGMTTCPRCDILTRRPQTCGFCAAELLREEAA